MDGNHPCHRHRETFAIPQIPQHRAKAGAKATAKAEARAKASAEAKAKAMAEAKCKGLRKVKMKVGASATDL